MQEKLCVCRSYDVVLVLPGSLWCNEISEYTSLSPSLTLSVSSNVKKHHGRELTSTNAKYSKLH